MSAPKLFQSYIQREKKGCLSVGPLKSKCGRVVSDSVDMSELLADAFPAVFVKDAPSAQHQIFAGVLDEVHVFLGSVVRVLSSWNSFSVAGLDGLHPHLLKHCSTALSLTYYILLVRSLEERVLPNLWKTSILAPLYKNGLRCESLDYRSVNLAFVCCKLLEVVIVS